MFGVLAILVGASASPLSDSLSGLQFLHEGIVNASNTFSFQRLYCGYLEAENVSSYLSSWGEGNPCPYLWETSASPPGPPYKCNATGAISNNTDTPGGDFAAQMLPRGSPPSACEALCCATDGCDAFTYAPSAPSDFLSCTAGSACCYLKAGTNTQKSYPGLFSGTVTPGPPAPVSGSAPPLGMRSAVPLGGLGAGTMELRADGTFHEVTYMNAHPSGAAKQGVLADALLGYRVDGAGGDSAARALRTHPPPYAAPGVASLGYSGTYPAARLRVAAGGADGADVALFAYAPFTPSREQDMAHPAVAFSLQATSTASSPINVTLYLQLPQGAWNDCDRTGDGSNTISTSAAPSAAACLHACAAAPACAAWTYTAAGGACALTASPNLSRFRAGVACGVRGGWVESVGGGLTFVGDGGGNDPTNAQVGDVTLRPGAGAVASGALLADDPAALWAAFAAPGAPPPAGTAAPGTAPTAAAAGALTATITLQPGETGAVSIVWAWHFPHKLWWKETVGQYYASLWEDSTDVAAALSPALAGVVAAINAHHTALLGPAPGSPLPPSPIPAWLRDVLVNQFSHMRMMHWTADGRMREYEAPDCPDIDSVHNDYQRHLPYIWAAPRFEISKFREYARGQYKDGHIPEFLGDFGLGPLDNTGGRTMADTTTLWVTELYEFWINTADVTLLNELWPAARAAVGWLISAAAQIGLPWHLVCTYDILVLEAYNTTTYNSFLHMLAMAAGRELATVVGDTATASAASAALARAQGAVENLLWNSTYSYLRAYTGGDAVMSDALYGQEIALHHGLEWFFDKAKLSAHLAAELKYNGNPYGLTTITGRHEPPPLAGKHAASRARALARAGVDTEDDTIWLQAAPTWSVMALRLAKEAGAQFQPLTAQQIADALEPTRAQLENYRSRLNDMWNFAGLNSGAKWGADSMNGMPWVTAHYGFTMVDFYLFTALTGQRTNIPQGRLSFDPVYACPYTLPVLLQGVEGTLSCAGGGGQYTLTVLFGALSLPAGGLSAAGTVCDQAVNLGEGQSVSW